MLPDTTKALFTNLCGTVVDYGCSVSCVSLDSVHIHFGLGVARVACSQFIFCLLSTSDSPDTVAGSCHVAV